MAKLETTLNCNFYQLIKMIEDGILDGSKSAILKDSTDFYSGGASCSVRVFERYSMADRSRVSMTVTIFQSGNEEVHLSAITSGGGLSMFADDTKTWGEASFLDKLKEIL